MRFLRRAINRARLEQAWLIAQAEQRHANAVNRADRATLQRLNDAGPTPHLPAAQHPQVSQDPQDAKQASKFRGPFSTNQSGDPQCPQ